MAKLRLTYFDFDGGRGEPRVLRYTSAALRSKTTASRARTGPASAT